MVSQGLSGNLGDPGCSPIMGVVADNPKRRGGHEDALEVGPTHIRGVVRVMAGEGLGLTRRGWQLHVERGGTHPPCIEMGIGCKRNSSS
jgi:hypothetical protein